MVLALAIGWALERFADVRQAMVLALFAGLVLAPLLPLGKGGGCGVDPPAGSR